LINYFIEYTLSKAFIIVNEVCLNYGKKTLFSASCDHLKIRMIKNLGMLSFFVSMLPEHASNTGEVVVVLKINQ